MDYFLLKKDKRCSYTPRILDWFNSINLSVFSCFSTVEVDKDFNKIQKMV